MDKARPGIRQDGAHQPKNPTVQQRGIIREPKVVRRLKSRSALETITSNGTIAAAMMVVAALLAVIVANSPAYEPLHHVLEAPLTLGVGPLTASISVEGFVNDFLMAVFFLLVGIELKYEMTVGQLRRPRQAALPMLAAVGGVCVPALVYLAFNHGGASHGWAVPIATDIAFALGVMSLLGDRVASETKVFFQTLAIADDIVAIVVLALFYGQTPQVAWVAASLIVVVLLAALSRARVYSAKPYLLVGLALWFCMYNSGIHATLAGVVLAFFLPARSDVRLSSLRSWLGNQAQVLEDRYDDDMHVLGQHAFTDSANHVERVLHHVTPPLQRVERTIATSVNFLILPIFAFVNAQVRLVGLDVAGLMGDPVALGVFLGAVAGKPLGIILTTWALVKVGFARLPRRVSWDQVVAVGIMGGMGFTMSILISGLAFADPLEVNVAKCAILAASLASGLLGMLYMRVGDPLVVRLVRWRRSRAAAPEGQ
ncbi:Na+/H+ antiporter NhaA [Olsenella massiliensis]|uniref:Na+/H+ antiporter NhaA n=1 Tax=Olsenella massiliensis TaxID=1622075 RepID=UPI00071C9145|nr:Na+/H+ antiporter NhaA [Olsenella massiliensis]